MEQEKNSFALVCGQGEDHVLSLAILDFDTHFSNREILSVSVHCFLTSACWFRLSLPVTLSSILIRRKHFWVIWSADVLPSWLIYCAMKNFLQLWN